MLQSWNTYMEGNPAILHKPHKFHRNSAREFTISNFFVFFSETPKYGFIQVKSGTTEVPNFTLILQTSNHCGAKNLKIATWLSLTPALVRVTTIKRHDSPAATHPSRYHVLFYNAAYCVQWAEYLTTWRYATTPPSILHVKVFVVAGWQKLSANALGQVANTMANVLWKPGTPCYTAGQEQRNEWVVCISQ